MWYNERTKLKGEEVMMNTILSAGIMPYLVDIVVLVFIVLFTLRCAKKGFVDCLFGFISGIASIVIAFSFASLAVSLTGGLFGIQASLQTNLTEAFSQLNGFNIPLDPNVDLVELLATQDMSQIMVNLIVQNWTGVEIPAGHTIAMMVGETVAEFATLLTAGVALFIIARIVFAILRKFFNFVASAGILGTLNKLLGACIGLVESVLIVSILVAILALVPPMMEFLNSSVILTWLYNSNPLMWLLSLFLTKM